MKRPRKIAPLEALALLRRLERSRVVVSFDLTNDVCESLDETVRAELAAARDFRKELNSVLECAADGCFGKLYESCSRDCICIMCSIRKALRRHG